MHRTDVQAAFGTPEVHRTDVRVASGTPEVHRTDVRVASGTPEVHCTDVRVASATPEAYRTSVQPTSGVPEADPTEVGSILGIPEVDPALSGSGFGRPGATPITIRRDLARLADKGLVVRTHGAVTTEHLRRYRVDKAFLGVDGLSLRGGLSAHSEKEAAIYLAVAASAGHVFLLCDSSKLEHDQYFQFAPLAAVGTLITDPQAPASVVAQYREAGLTVLA